MKIIDAYILARTKRKTRRVRTALITIVSSLLFAVLFFAVLIAAGVVQSVGQVKDAGFNSRYLTAVLQSGSPGFDYEALQSSITTEMDAELRTKNINVTPDTHNDPSYIAEHERRLNKALLKASQEDVKKLEKQITTFGSPTAVFHLNRLQALMSMLTYHPDPAKDPKVEELVNVQAKKEPPSTKDQASQLEFLSVEKDMLRTQLLPGQSFDWQPGQPVPIIVAYPYLEQLADKSFANVDAATKNQGYKDLIAAYTGKTLDYCWRNATALEQLQKVVQYNDTAEQDDNGQTRPIAIPVCGDFDQKVLKDAGLVTDTAQQEEPEPLFKTPEPPAPKIIKLQFKIVGFVPAPSQFSSDILENMFVAASTIPFVTNPAIMPAEVAAMHPQFAPDAEGMDVRSTNLITDFASRGQQRDFLAAACQGDECVDGSKPLMVPFGNLAVALETPLDFGFKVLLGTTAVMMVIAALMIMFTISKVIADSTKEIAVFRALGARRRDIAQIYFTYGIMLATSALLFALVFAFAAAYSISLLFSDRFAAALIQAVGAYTQPLHVSLFGYQPLWLVAVAAALLLAALVGISIPIAAAAKRKLITMLREE